MHLIVVLLAHTTQYALFDAPLQTAYLFLGSVSNAPAALHSNLCAPLHLAALSRWTMSTAKASLFDVFGTPRVGAGFAFGTMGDA